MKTWIKSTLNKMREIIPLSFYCPKCGDWIGDDEDICQTCGYPWTD